MTQRFELPWGDCILPVELPRRWRVLGVARPDPAPIVDNVAQACQTALHQPLGVPPLEQRDLSGKRVVIVVDDHTRPTPVADFIQPVLAQLVAAGASPETTEVLVACGVHRASTPQEVDHKLGPEVARTWPWHCHDAHHKGDLWFLGTTARGTPVWLNRRLVQADLVVCLGAVEPHLLLGFGGGLKMLLPGCAGADTIGHNHLQGVSAAHFDYVGVHGQDSPMRLDLEEAAGLLDKEVFIVNAMMNHLAQPAGFFCGDAVAAHRAAEQRVAQDLGLPVSQQADVVLSNSAPMDADLRQAFKCMGNTLFACRPGGVLLGCLRARRGLGEVPLSRKGLSYDWLRCALRLLPAPAILPLVRRLRAEAPVEEVFLSHFALQMLRRNHLGIFSPTLPDGFSRKVPVLRGFGDPRAMIRWAQAKAPRDATVWIFPHGGSTYARPGRSYHPHRADG